MQKQQETQKEKTFFVKEQGYNHSANVNFTYGLLNKASGAWSNREINECSKITEVGKFLYEKYKFSQDEVDANFENSKGFNADIIEKAEEFVLILTGQLIISEKTGKLTDEIYQWIVRGANNHTHSLCSSILMLEGELRGFTVGERKDITVKTDLRPLTAIEQNRFKNYQLGLTQPVDENADQFLSYITPMILAIHGFKVHESFVNYMVEEIKARGIKVPKELEDLQKGIVTKFVDSEGKVQNYEAKRELINNFSYYGIEAYYNTFIAEKTSGALEELYDAVNDFNKNQVQDVTDLDFLQINDNLKQMMKLNYELNNGIIAQKDVEKIEKSFEKLKKEDKSTEKGAQLLALYATIFNYKRHNPIIEKEKKIKESKIKDVDPLVVGKTLYEAGKRTRVEPTAEVAFTAITEEKSLPVVEEKREIEQKNLENIVEEVQNEESVVIEVPVNEDAKTRRHRYVKNVEEKKDTSGLTIEKYAENLFLNSKEYDLQKIASLEISVTKKVFDEEVVTTERPFEKILKSRNFLTGQLKSMKETCRDIREAYYHMSEGMQKGFLKWLGFIDKAQQSANEMVENYATLDEKGKNILRRLAVCDADIRNDLIEKIDRLEDEQKQAKERKVRDAKIVNEIKERYNIQEIQESTEAEIEQSIAEFFSEEK